MSAVDDPVLSLDLDTPDDVQVLFHAEGVRDSVFRNIVWDANCTDPQTDPQQCFVVAFDHHPRLRLGADSNSTSGNN